MNKLQELKDYQIGLLGLILAIGLIFSTFIISNAVIAFQKLNTQTLTVTGSASRNVTSDRGMWKAYYETRDANLKSAYATMTQNSNTVKEFLIANGIKEENITFSPVNSYAIYQRTPAGYETNKVEGYRLSQNVEVSSDDINKITDISKKVSELVEKNVEITSNSTQYFVSNQDELKVEVLADATKNAKDRAQSMVKSTNGHIGFMNSAKMGVFQIVPINSTDVSDYGINDTQSIEKKVIAVVNATFSVK